MKAMKILIGCEESQTVCIAFRMAGIEAYSCDLLPCSGNHPEWHLQMDVFQAINAGELKTQDGNTIFIDKWTMGIFFPDCTYLTCSAEWAYKEPPYHQKLKEGTLFGLKRRLAREMAVNFVMRLYNSKITYVAIENPVGVLSSKFKSPNQIIQPYQFGDDASKKTCLWLKNLPPLTIDTSKIIQPKIVNGKPRWGNQTDSGQNKLPPTEDRAKIRSKTFQGIANSMADQWSKFLLK